MKKILVLTDLGPQADELAKSAVALSASLDVNLILFNTFISQPILSEYGGSPWSVEELLWADEGKEKLAFIKEEMAPVIAALPAVLHHPSVECQQGLGSLTGQVNELLHKETIELIMMGTRQGSAWDHLLMGSDTMAVINQADRPVIVLPPGRSLEQIKKVTIATDYDDADLNAVHYLTRLGRIFDFKIDIVHVKLWGEQTMPEATRLAFERHVAKFNFPDISYLTVGGKDLVNRLNALCAENGSDLLVLVHDRHSLLSRLFNGTQAKSLLEKQVFPVMIIPAAMAQV